jgi:hypothetical protein
MPAATINAARRPNSVRLTLVRSYPRYPCPLVSPEQVAARSAPRYQAQAPVPANPLANLVQAKYGHVQSGHKIDFQTFNL